MNTFVYNTTTTFNGQSVYQFTEPQFRDQDYLTTADANEYPVAFVDRRGGIAR